MQNERKTDADFGLTVDETQHKNRLNELFALRMLLVLLCFSVCALFVQQAVYRDEAKRYETAVSAVQMSVDHSVSVSIAEEDAMNAPVNINTADVQELCRLKGIGEAKANAIIDYRNNNGPFTYKEELMNVRGIGEKMYADIEHQIILKDEELIN